MTLAVLAKIDWASILPGTSTVTVSLNSSVLSISLPSSGTGFNSTSLITAIVSIFALSLGIYNAYTRQKDKQPSIKVDCSEGDIEYSKKDSELVIFVKGYNNSQLPVTITRYMFFLPKYGLGFYFHGMYKSKVLPGSNYLRWVPSEIFAESLRRSDWFSFLKRQRIIEDDKLPKTIKLEAWLVDEAERIYKSKSIEFDIENRLKNTNRIISEGSINSLISMSYYTPGETRRKLWIYKYRLMAKIYKMRK